MIQLTLTLKMTTAQVVETSVTVNNNSPIQDYVHQDDQTQPTLLMANVAQGSHSELGLPVNKSGFFTRVPRGTGSWRHSRSS